MAGRTLRALVACICLIYPVLGYTATLLPGGEYKKTGTGKVASLELDLTAEEPDSTWTFIVQMASSSASATVSIGGDTIYSRDGDEYSRELAGGTTYVASIDSYNQYTAKLVQPLAAWAVALTVGGSIAVAAVFCTLIGSKTMQSACESEDRVVVNYDGCYMIVGAMSLGPIILLIMGFVVQLLPLQIIGGVWIGVMCILAGRRSIEVSADKQSVTITPYYLFVVPCCRKVIPFEDVENFVAVAVRGKHGQVAYGLALKQFSTSKTFGISGVAAGGRRGQDAVALLAKLNGMIRRVTPHVTRPDPPLVDPGMHAAATAAVQQMLRAQLVQNAGSVPYTGGAGGSVEQQQQAIAAQIAALQAQQASLAKQSGGSHRLSPNSKYPTATAVPSQAVTAQAIAVNMAAAPAVPYTATVAHVPYAPPHSAAGPNNSRRTLL